MKKTSSPQYFNLKSCLITESLTLVAFVVFLRKNLENVTINGSLTDIP